MVGTRILSQKTVYKAKLYDIVANTLAYPTGREVVHDDIYRHPSVAVLPITKEWDIYLIKEPRYLLGQTCLETMAGFMDAGETPEQTARRELKEEMGIVAESLEFLRTVTMSASVVHAQSHIFIARGLTFGEQQLEEDEIIEIVKMPISEAIEHVLKGNIITATSIIALFLLKEKLVK